MCVPLRKGCGGARRDAPVKKGCQFASLSHGWRVNVAETYGRWRGMLPMLGVDSRFLTGKHGPCPVCDGTDRFRFDDKEGKGTWICSKCGAGDGFALVMRLKGWDFKEAAAEVQALIGKVPPDATPRRETNEQRLRDAMNAVWQAGVLVEAGDPVGKYLAARGIRLSAFPPALRYHEKCRYQGDEASWHPAMLAKVVGPDGKPCSVHRTYLTANGTKAALPEARKLMAGKMAKGCAIRLAPVAPKLGIAEGIETALSASIIWNMPVWAAVSAGMLMQWEPPASVTEVVVFADNDKSYAGQSAGFALAHRLAAVKGLTVSVEMPVDQGCDWNDVLQAERVAA